MNKVLLGSLVAGALVIAGCGSKTPEASTETVVVDEVVAPVIGPSDAEVLAALISSINGSLGSVHFDFDKFNIKADQQGIVSQNASILNGKDASAFNIKVEGNCDEWGSDEYNYALGLKRAKSAKDALVSRGIAAERVSVVSYGESNPVCTEHSKACDAQNRRADFKVLQ
ncbi:OmpA family protein [Campylobacter sp. 19-13652]|uniref:OmpA family protein n=1 Tax=Campylobacter sp. 19-13652 TaxID=2840180 RepID=UPI001C799675|nr:OmpA family protein [Campylobacter sp. 19-13652]BCX78953.1 peptidoglycan-associated lipoprotein [Campylobacter sp. 19-13652]